MGGRMLTETGVTAALESEELRKIKPANKINERIFCMIYFTGL